MGTNGDRPRRWIALVAALLLAALAAGCGYDAKFRELTRPLALYMAVTYGDNRSDVTVRYSIPPPPRGKSYVLWAYSQGRAQVAKLGAVPPGTERTAKGSANFLVVGVVITEEISPDVSRMEGTGIIELTLEDGNLGPSKSGSVPAPAKR